VLEPGGYTVGVLVQANHGRRGRLAVNGAPVGQAIGLDEVPAPGAPPGAGSIIVVVATDAPLLPIQCARVAQRASFGIARTGGVGEHWSGDLLLAFSTANRGLPASTLGAEPPLTVSVEMLADAYIDAIFDAVVEATEEAIVNALLAAETMAGRDGITAHAIDAERLLEVLDRHAARGT
jgi:D-aminopeptidase